MYWFSLLVIAVTLLSGSVAQAASYQKTKGTIVDPMLNSSGRSHSYSGNNLEPAANLADAYLSNSILHGANLTGANLTGFDLTGLYLTNAILTRTARVDGYRSACACRRVAVWGSPGTARLDTSKTRGLTRKTTMKTALTV